MSTPSTPPSASRTSAAARASAIAPAVVAEHAERIAPSAVAARLVPYGFARSGQILVAHQHADGLEVWISERTSDAALAEVARNFGALSVVRVPADELA
ncbi:type II secretion system protein GspE, partial [Paraburkholderia agricolaris]